MENLLTLTIYKNEYKPVHVEYFKRAFRVVEESERVLVIAGEEDELAKVQGLMFSTDEDVKNEFPSYRTEEERRLYTERKFDEVYKTMQAALLDIINHGAVNGEFNMMRNVYFEMKEYVNK
jgi:stalled ribosome rescue protein Dom34